MKNCSSLTLSLSFSLFQHAEKNEGFGNRWRFIFMKIFIYFSLCSKKKTSNVLLDWFNNQTNECMKKSINIHSHDFFWLVFFRRKTNAIFLSVGYAIDKKRQCDSGSKIKITFTSEKKRKRKTEKIQLCFVAFPYLLWC